MILCLDCRDVNIPTVICTMDATIGRNWVKDTLGFSVLFLTTACEPTITSVMFQREKWKHTHTHKTFELSSVHIHSGTVIMSLVAQESVVKKNLSCSLKGN